MKTEQKADPPDIDSIGGWLTLLAIGLPGALLSMTVSWALFGEMAFRMASSRDARMDLWVIVGADAIRFTLCLATTIFFFRLSPWTRPTTQIFLVVNVLAVLVIEKTRTYANHQDLGLSPSIIWAIIYAVAFIPYMAISKRAKSTFRKRDTGADSSSSAAAQTAAASHPQNLS